MSPRPALRQMYSASYFLLFQLIGSFQIYSCLEAMISVTLILKIIAHKALGVLVDSLTRHRQFKCSKPLYQMDVKLIKDIVN